MSQCKTPNYNTFKAAGDLSSYQYHFVKFNGTATANDDTVTVADLGSNPVGILMNAPSAAGDAALVACIGGGAKLLLGDTIGAGMMLKPDASGHGVGGTAAGDFIGARALQYGVVSDIIEVEVMGFTDHAGDA